MTTITVGGMRPPVGAGARIVASELAPLHLVEELLALDVRFVGLGARERRIVLLRRLPLRRLVGALHVLLDELLQLLVVHGLPAWWNGPARSCRPARHTIH